MKTCTKCKLAYPATVKFFPLDNRALSWLSSWCKACHRLYYQLNKEKRKRYAKKYRQAHKDKIAECYKEYGKRYRRTIAGCLRTKFNSMKHRCNSPKNKRYYDYGGRGIKCLFKSSDEFVDYVVNVLKVDPRGLEIDRKDNNGNYERGNIRFVTRSENCLNRGR